MRHIVRAAFMVMALRFSVTVMQTDPWKGVAWLMMTVAFGVYIGWVMREEAKE